MKDSLLHIIIIWSEGKNMQSEIIEDVQKSFHDVSQFSITWQSHSFYENLQRFYAHSLQDKSPVELKQILANKIAHCGDKPFTALIFEDKNPSFEQRKTSNGMKLVNSNVFDKKAMYRKWLGGGHKIHASDTLYETNKDVVLLFGCTTQEFQQKFPPTTIERLYTENIVGVPEYKSVRELFFVLNETLPYVVLRNFEGLPDSYFVGEHGDIDLLVEDKNFIVYLTGAIPKFPEEKNRVYHEIQIAGEKIPFDFRFLGDGYYDTKWQANLLKERALENDFYRVDPENYFYSLVYHAYIQKRKISPDYKERLVPIANAIEVHYSATQTDETTFNQLNDFMVSQGYDYTLPKDSTVYFNKKFVEQLPPNSANNLDRIHISSTISRTESQAYIADVFETKEGILKIANNPIGSNEVEFLTAMASSTYVPRIITATSRNESTEVLLEKINGIPFSKLVTVSQFWNVKSIQHFVIHLLQILEDLLQHNVSHRDIRPANMLVIKNGEEFEPRIIDFGWSCYISEETTATTPSGLGHTYVFPGVGFSDVYAMGKCIQFLGKNLTFLSPIAKQLMEVEPAHYQDRKALLEKLEGIRQRLESTSLKGTKKDKIAILVKRYKVNDRLTTLLGEKGVKRLKKYL